MTSLGSSGNVQWPLADHLGTIRDIASYNSSTDDTNIANHRRYDSFGNLVSETNSAVDLIFGFTGRPLDDAIGLQNNLNRWYDASTGIWISEDPIGFAANDTSLRRYVSNTPTVSIDPTGHVEDDGGTPGGHRSPPLIKEVQEGKPENAYDGIGVFDSAEFYQRLKKLLILEQKDWETMTRGCVGLAMVRLGYSTGAVRRPGDPEFPHLLPNTLIFTMRPAAEAKLEELNEAGKKAKPQREYVLVAIQLSSRLKPHKGKEPPEGQIGPEQIDMLASGGHYNFATWRACYWEYMNHGIDRGIGPPKVIHGVDLPGKDVYKHTYYAVIEKRRLE